MKRLKTHELKTHEQVRQEFRDAGISIRDWAKRNGYSASVVYTVLNDRRPGVRGESHRVAVALGLKPSGAQVGAA
jgi:gp16 family phage-associated protein